MSDAEESEPDGGSHGDTSEESVDSSDTDKYFEESSDDGGDAGGADHSDVKDEEAGNAGDGGFIWLPIVGDDPGPNPIPFTAVPGPVHPPPPEARPMDYVDKTLTPAFIDCIVRETNRYVEQWIESHVQYLRDNPRSAVHSWIRQGQTNAEEVKAFLGVTVNMGLVRKRTLKAYWDTSSPSQSTPWFVEHFSRERNELMLKFLHFNNNLEMPDREDPAFALYKIQPLITHFQGVFKNAYQPEQNISIDESNIGFKGKTPHLRQHMPRKHHHARLGTKLWCVSENYSGYTSYFEVFRGEHQPEDAQRPEGATDELVMRLLAACGFLNRGHHLGVNKYFTSPALFRYLYAQQTTATGAVRINRRGLPRACLKTRLRKREVVVLRDAELLCVATKDGTSSSRRVLLSTAVTAGNAEIRSRGGKLVQRPNIIVKYDQSMRGVGKSDAKLCTYLPENHRKLKWTTKVALALIGRAILNCYLLYDKNTNDRAKLTRYHFMAAVVEGLAGGYFPPKVIREGRTAAEIHAAGENPLLPGPAQPPQPSAFGEGHDLVRLPVGRKRNCAAGHDSRVRSAYHCPACNVGLCPQCFAEYHRRPRH